MPETVKRSIIIGGKAVYYQCSIVKGVDEISLEEFLKMFASVLTNLKTDQEALQKNKQTSATFTPEQIANLKAMKARLGINHNDQLNNFIREWSGGTLATWVDLKPEWCDDFLKHMNAHYK